jgi:hypothetical protein
LLETFSRPAEQPAAANVATLAAASRGLTGADLKAVVEDGKLLFAHDKVHGQQPRPPEVVKLGFSVE